VEGEAANSEIAADGVVRLRPLQTVDLASHAAGHDGEIVRWVNDGVVSTDDQHLAWLRRQHRAWQDGEDVVDLGVEDVATGVLTGIVGLQRALPYLAEGQVNLTYSVYPDHRHKGLACRAVRLAMAVAATRWRVREFVIRCDPANTASAAVARRLGFSYLGPRHEPEGRLDWYVHRAAS